MTKEKKLEERVAIVETKTDYISDNVERILNNHLPHIQTELETIHIKFAYYLGGATAVGLLGNYVLNTLLK